MLKVDLESRMIWSFLKNYKIVIMSYDYHLNIAITSHSDINLDLLSLISVHKTSRHLFLKQLSNNKVRTYFKKGCAFDVSA